MQKVDQAQTLSKPIQSQRSGPSFKQFLLVAGMLFNPVAASAVTCPNQMTREIFLGGVDPTDRNIGNLYRKWSLVCHPDKNPDPNAEEQFRSLTDVRDSLVNTTSRNIDREDEYSYEGFADVGDLFEEARQDYQINLGQQIKKVTEALNLGEEDHFNIARVLNYVSGLEKASVLIELAKRASNPKAFFQNDPQVVGLLVSSGVEVLFPALDSETIDFSDLVSHVRSSNIIENYANEMKSSLIRALSDEIYKVLELIDNGVISDEVNLDDYTSTQIDWLVKNLPSVKAQLAAGTSLKSIVTYPEIINSALNLLEPFMFFRSSF
jgi:curved DNA-binding protein CbpA